MEQNEKNNAKFKAIPVTGSTISDKSNKNHSHMFICVRVFPAGVTKHSG